MQKAEPRGTIAGFLTLCMLVPWIFGLFLLGKPGAGSPDPLMFISSCLSFVVLAFTIGTELYIILSTALNKSVSHKCAALKLHFIALGLFGLLLLRFVSWHWLSI
jgi:hypothetical protein